MGHNISAIVCKPSREIEKIAEYDLAVLHTGDFVIIPMDANHIDQWTDRLGLSNDHGKSEVILDGTFAHYIAQIAADGDYALIETDYFGGAGDQVAAVYRKAVIAPLFSSQRQKAGPINEALRMIGVKTSKGFDEFDTLGLGSYRHFEDCFERYYE